MPIAADTFGGFGKDAIKAMKILHDKMAASDKAYPFSRVIQIFQVAVLRGVVNQLIRRGPFKDVEDMGPIEPPVGDDIHSTSLVLDSAATETRESFSPSPYLRKSSSSSVFNHPPPPSGPLLVDLFPSHSPSSSS